MKKNEITSAIGDKIETLGLSTAFPNVPHDGVTPYLEVTFATARREDPSLKGGTIMRELGSFQVSVVTKEGTATKFAEDTADQVSGLFPKGTQMFTAGGQVKINAAPDIKEGYNAGAEWRVPVLCSYEAVRD